MRVGGQARLGWRATGFRAAVRNAKRPALSDTLQLLIIHGDQLAPGGIQLAIGATAAGAAAASKHVSRCEAPNG